MDFDPNLDNSGGDSSIHMGEKKSKGGIIALVIILLIVGGLALAIALDWGNIRSQHISGFLRNMPLVGSLFSDEEEEDPYEEMTEEELREAFRVQSDLVAGLTNQRNDLTNQLNQANARINHLQRFENAWQQYREASADFTQMLAHNEPFEFFQFFYAIVDHDLVPQDILAAVFAEAVAINAFNAELQMVVSTMNAMEADRAAEDLEALLTRDPILAVRLARAMGNTRRAEIFNEMEYSVSSTFHILLSTAPPTFLPLIPPIYLPEFIPPALPAPVIPFDDEEYEDEDEYEEEED
jgi:hypothetical protein